VWPIPGDLCTARNPKVIVSGLIQDEDGSWSWNTDVPSRAASVGSPCIVIASVALDWTFVRGIPSSRPLVYVLHPHIIGWDDYGNYDVKVRP